MSSSITPADKALRLVGLTALVFLVFLSVNGSRHALSMVFIVAVSSFAGRNRPRPSALRMAVYLSLSLIAVFSLAYAYNSFL